MTSSARTRDHFLSCRSIRLHQSGDTVSLSPHHSCVAAHVYAVIILFWPYILLSEYVLFLFFCPLLFLYLEN